VGENKMDFLKNNQKQNDFNFGSKLVLKEILETAREINSKLDSILELFSAYEVKIIDDEIKEELP